MKSQNPLERARQNALKFVAHANVQNRKRAKLGWRRNDTDVVLEAPGKRGELYITWTQEGTRDTAINEAGVQHSRLLPVLIERRSEVNYIVGIDFSDPLAIAAITNNQFGVPAHPLTSHSDVTTAFAPGDGVTFVYNETLGKWEYGSFPDDEYIEDLIAATIAATAPIGSNYDDGAGELELYLAVSVADRMLVSTGVDTWAETPLTPFARTYLDDSDQATTRATLGVSDENIQDLIAAMLADSSSIDFSYNDGAGTFTAAVIDEYIQDLIGAMFTGNTETGGTITYQDSDGTIDFVLDDEYVQDLIGLMFSSNTETGGSLTYDDATGKINFDAQTAGDARYGRLAAANSWTDNQSIASAATAGSALSVIRNLASGSTNAPVVLIQQDHASDDQAALSVVQDAAASVAALLLTHNAASGAAQAFTALAGNGATSVGLTLGATLSRSMIMAWDESNSQAIMYTNGFSYPIVLGSNWIRMLTNGNVGFGVQTAQGRLHAHDGTGGQLFVTKTAIDGTAQTIIPDGTGDVVRGMFFISVVQPSSGSVFMTSNAIANNSNIDIYSSGANVVNLRVNSNGSVDVRRTGGSLTYSLSLFMVWL